MRYAFRGKSRATLQPISGHVEAANSESAIDKLADNGIIGVLTVRPDPLPEVAAPTTDEVLAELVEKMDRLMGHVEKLMARPTVTVRDGASGKPIGHNGRPQLTQDAALKEILRTNLDLRKSLEKLSPGVSTRSKEREASGSAKPHDGPRARERTLRSSPLASRPD